MDVANVVRVLLRHWFMVLIGLTLTLGSAYAVYKVIPRTYEATAQTMLLLRPTASNPDLETSPFLYLPDGVTALARVVAVIPNTPEYRESMEAEGFEPNYTVALPTRDPIVVFTVEGADPENALLTRDELVARFMADLDRVQEEEGVPDRQWAHLRVLHSSDVPTTQSGTALQGAAGVVGLGGLLTLLGVALLERRSHRRVVKHSRESEDLRAFRAEEDPGGSPPRRRSDPNPEGAAGHSRSRSRSAARAPAHASDADAVPLRDHVGS